MSDVSVVIVGAKRTAIGSFLGQFTGVPTPKLGATAIRAALEQSGVAPADVSAPAEVSAAVAELESAAAAERQIQQHHRGAELIWNRRCSFCGADSVCSLSF